MQSNVYRVSVLLPTTEFRAHSKQTVLLGLKSHCKQFTMENSNKNTGFSACVMCASNFTDNDAQTIVTSCGHMYHRQCLSKWFASVQDLNPHGHLTCPECRTILNPKNDIKPVYLYYSTPDDIKSELEKRDNKEKAHLNRLLRQSQNEVKKIKQQLSSEKAKNMRLTSKIDALELQFKVKTEHSCYNCEATTLSGHRKMMATKPKAKKTTVAAASVGTEKLARKLRNREYSYSL